MHYYHYYYPQKDKKLHLIKSQIELLKLLACGYTLNEIANLTQKTYDNIKKRTQLLYKKFAVNSRQELIIKAKKEGFIVRDDISSRFKIRFNKTKFKAKNKPEFTLTDFETKLLKYKSQGFKCAEIIDKLGLWSYYGLKQKEFYLCAKMNCSNILEAVFYAKKLGII